MSLQLAQHQTSQLGFILGCLNTFMQEHFRQNQFFSTVVVRPKLRSLKERFRIMKVDFGFMEEEEQPNHQEQLMVGRKSQRQRQLRLRRIQQQQLEVEKESVIDDQVVSSQAIKIEEGLERRAKGAGASREKRGPYRVYSVYKKEEAMRMLYHGYTMGEVQRLLGIPAKNLKRWTIVGTDRKRGGGRKQLDVEMEGKLYHWILEQMRVNQSKVTRTQIRTKALELTNHKGIFKASKGWTDKFIRKHNLKRAAMKEMILILKDEAVSDEDKPRNKQEPGAASNCKKGLTLNSAVPKQECKIEGSDPKARQIPDVKVEYNDSSSSQEQKCSVVFQTPARSFRLAKSEDEQKDIFIDDLFKNTGIGIEDYLKL